MSNDEMSNYANTCCCSCTQPSRGITSYEEIGQTRVPEPRAITRPTSNIISCISCISHMNYIVCRGRSYRSVSHRILHIYVLYTRVNRGRDRLTCIIAKKRMFTRSFFFPDAAADGMTSCTYVIFVLARLPAAVYYMNRYKYNIIIWIGEIWINFLRVPYVFFILLNEILTIRNTLHAINPKPTWNTYIIILYNNKILKTN